MEAAAVETGLTFGFAKTGILDPRCTPAMAAGVTHRLWSLKPIERKNHPGQWKLMSGLSRIVIASTTTMLLGCSGTVEQVTLPNGTSAYHVGGSGIQRSMADCQSKAQETCPAGYELANQINGGAGEFQYQRFMTVRCKSN